MRLFSSFTHYLATQDAKGIQIHHFAPAKIECDLSQKWRIQLNMLTDYPWQGNIKLQVVATSNSPWVLSLRIPEWSQNPTLAINGKMVTALIPEKGYLVIEREWQADDVIELELGMETIFVASNPRVDATRGCLAIQRGPLVYCLEDRDQEIKSHLLDVEIDKKQPLLTRWDNGLLDGVMVVEVNGQFIDSEVWHGHLYQPEISRMLINSRPTHLVAIPYYAWGNRGIGGMRVWIPKKSA
jgi:uncharacterized protein